jgi:hypothetical protein
MARMRRFVVLVVLGSVMAALASFACGPSDEKPPMTPDPADVGEGGAPQAAPAPPAK